jgi:hypothetical protein
MSFSELLRPEPGWQVDHAILTTYSTDLVVLVTALISLSGCNIEQRTKGSRVELVRAMELLRGRVRVLAQKGRVSLPGTPRAILGLLDQFLIEIDANEETHSWHPKAALIRYKAAGRPDDVQWRLWIGSRNLTRAMNWEAGLVINSRADGRGKKITGLPELGHALVERAKLPGFEAVTAQRELALLTWESPSGADVRSIRLLGPELDHGMPGAMQNATEVCLVSPFLDLTTVRAMGNWGGKKVRRTLLSTPTAMNAVAARDATVFDGKFHEVLKCGVPEVIAVGCDPLADEPPVAVETAEGEDISPAGLHAKLLYAACGSDRRLWLGSANATGRAWSGRNFEIVAEMALGKEPADALLDFIRNGEHYVPKPEDVPEDAEKVALEHARNHVCGTWRPMQRAREDGTMVFCGEPPALGDPTICLQVAALNNTWTPWPTGECSVLLASVPLGQRTDFLQVRIIRGDHMCAWVQLAPFDPRLDESRNRAAIAQYLTPQVFLLWLRSMLSQESPKPDEDWDSHNQGDPHQSSSTSFTSSEGDLPTIEEILRAWARDPENFIEADRKMKAYVKGLEQCARETGRHNEAALLKDLQGMWATLAGELLPQSK